MVLGDLVISGVNAGLDPVSLPVEPMRASLDGSTCFFYLPSAAGAGAGVRDGRWYARTRTGPMEIGRRRVLPCAR